MKVLVLAGGNSTEREISIVSGTMVAKALLGLGHQCVLADVCFGAPVTDPEAAFSNPADPAETAAWIREQNGRLDEVKNRRSFFGGGILELCEAADTVFMALHGSNGEDGKIQAAFELLGIPFTGCGYLGSALAMNKEMSKQIFRENQVPTPEGIVVRRGDEIVPPAQNGVGLPCVVKPACGGSSVGVSIPRTAEEYFKALEDGFGYEDVLLVEKYISGREFSVGIVDGVVYPVIEIAPITGFYDYVNKYKAGSTVETCPANIPEHVREKMQKAALDAYKALRLDSYGRVDVMMDEDENVYCLEANTLPGMTPTSLLPQEAMAMGIDFPHLCEKLINVSMRGRRG